MDPADLERLIDRELHRLPSPRAPRTLLPRVMQAVRLADRPAAAVRPWFAWPRAWQVASLGGAVLLVSAAVYFWPAGLPVIGRTGGWLDGLRVTSRVLHPMAVSLVVFVGVMAAVSAACGAALRRVL